MDRQKGIGQWIPMDGSLSWKFEAFFFEPLYSRIGCQLNAVWTFDVILEVEVHLRNVYRFACLCPSVTVCVR